MSDADIKNMQTKVMNKIQLLKILFHLKKNSIQGLSLIELLVALVISGIALTTATSGFINLLSANQEVESKINRKETLTRALAYMQNELKSANQITQEASSVGGNCDSGSISSNECLVLSFPDIYADDVNSNCSTSPSSPAKVYYGFEDISSGTQIWLKPGVLKRKYVCENGVGTIISGNWTVIADGLVSVNEAQPTTTCTQDGGNNWPGDSTVYGRDSSGKGGFRFCLDPVINVGDDPQNKDRLVRVFLYGHIVGGNSNNQIMVNTTMFTELER